MVTLQMHMATRPKPASDPGLKALFAALDRRAILKQPISSRVELADALDISKQAISRWKRVPVLRAAEIAILIGVPKRVLRSDVYGAVPSRSKPRNGHRSIKVRRVSPR